MTILAWKGHRELRPELSAWLDQLAAEYAAARANAAETVARLRALTANAARLADGINMRFLYDAAAQAVRRRLRGGRSARVHQPLRSAGERMPPRQPGGDRQRRCAGRALVRAEPPLRLTRPRGQTLLSWSGTMFEYLMPLLFTRTLHQLAARSGLPGCGAAPDRLRRTRTRSLGHFRVRLQRARSHQIYQYRAFGVPALALNPATEDELVVSPYSTVLALQVDPAAATAQSGATEESGAGRARWGSTKPSIFRARAREDGARGVVIYCYMAHHQGMSLAALDNVLHRDVMQRRFHGDLRIRAVESLLFERHPDHASADRRDQEPSRRRSTSPATEEAAERVWTEETAAPARAPVRQRPLRADGHQLRRRLQPLERFRCDALALRHHARSLGQFHLHPRSEVGRGLGDVAQAVRGQHRAKSRCAFAPTAPKFTAASPGSKPFWTSPSRPKTTSNCGA